MNARIASVSARPLSVKLLDPFVIASGRVDVTQAVEVRVELEAGPARAWGIGEAATLRPVTREDQADVLGAMAEAKATLIGRELARGDAGIGDALAPWDDRPATRAGLETALLDALARLAGVPVRALLGGASWDGRRALVSDVTIPILEPARMAALARGWAARGFGCFKVKVGKDVDRDLAALEAVHRAVPEATFRVDANAGFTAPEAIRLAKDTERLGLVVECWEQPCAARDLAAMAEVCASLRAPVIADESVATLEDLEAVCAARAAHGVNLKLVKSGGPLAALAIGREAARRGMPRMIGGMVETWLGMTAAAHVAAALGGVELVDLDTAWLLDGDPYAGAIDHDGPRRRLGDAPGLGIHPPARV